MIGIGDYILDSNAITVKNFADKLYSTINKKNTFEIISKKLEDMEKKNWDKVARREIGRVVKQVYKEMFPNKNLEECVYVEGEGTPRTWRKPYELFGSRVYPDIAILKPVRVAIELDHSGVNAKRPPGSRLKIALAKAAFNYLSRNWDYCILLFYNENKEKPIKKYLNHEIERNIISMYERDFRTLVYIFE